MTLDEYKKKAKEENLNTFYINENYRNKVSLEDAVEALLEGGQKLVNLKQKRKEIADRKLAKEAEIDACATIEEINAILGKTKSGD